VAEPAGEDGVGAVEIAEADGADELAAGSVSIWLGMRDPHRTVTRPLSAMAWASRSQVLRQVSQPSAATCRMMSVSKTSQPGRAWRSGSVIVVLPEPLAPVTTNSGKSGTGSRVPQ